MVFIVLSLSLNSSINNNVSAKNHINSNDYDNNNNNDEIKDNNNNNTSTKLTLFNTECGLAHGTDPQLWEQTILKKYGNYTDNWPQPDYEQYLCMKTLGDSGNNKPGQPKIGTLSFSTLPEYDPKAPCGLWILKFEKASEVLLAFVNYIQYQNNGIYTQQQNDQIACIGNMIK